VTRRRAIHGVLLLAAVAAAWWLLSDGLTAEERRLVGAWRRHDESVGSFGMYVLTLDPDRTARMTALGMPWRAEVPPYDWDVKGGVIVVEPEPNFIRRAVRPVAGLTGVRVRAAGRATLEWQSDDEMDFVGAAGDRAHWVRVHEERP
jgi:hypothetical protein